jgi:hypothetical protein
MGLAERLMARVSSYALPDNATKERRPDFHSGDPPAPKR